MPALASGGTRDTAIARPGRVSDTSLRASAKASARSVIGAAIRSSRWGAVRIMICWIASGLVTWAIGRVSRNPTATAVGMPTRLTLNASPMIGSISGTTIIAPITTATESPSRP